MFTYFVHYEES